MNNLADLQKRKEMLRKDISEIEDTIRFKDPKKSLSKLTNGFTDQFVSDEFNYRGEHKTGLKWDKVFSYITGGTSERFLTSKLNEYGEKKLGINTKNIAGSITENALKIGISSLMATLTKKYLFHKKWKKKIIGLAIVYLSPFILDFAKEKLKALQDSKSKK